MDRKTFIQKTAGAVLITIPAYSLLGCSSSDNGTDNPDPDPDPKGDCLANGTKTAIGTNHGHTLTVSTADINAGVQKVYSIMGSSGHDHVVTLTAANFTALKSNSGISVTSTAGDGHTHTVSVSCA
ncbi:hypothetical protein KCTC52924_01394 [Arenibacter antarcticus]|uniref:Uncharacterized protein n=1 Tax=Arenibacter antarcticus TaxID=2040469 RepID=A0ABW5VDQ9_9FLAO|nr:hypothetical protein [Arenibacter sp. H213]